jgi:endonuclease/exonuclease/phosphatase family metal-dependent hydrolase
MMVRVFRVLSYNVRYFGHATRGLASTKKAMQRIAHAIAALDPLADIVCLQEVETSSFRSTVAHRTEREDETQLGRFTEMLHGALCEADRPGVAYEAFYFPAHTYRLGTYGARVYTTGLAVLALATCKVDHHNAAEPKDITHRHLHPVKALKQTRICAHVRLRHEGGEPIDIFNTHLSLPSTMSREFWTLPRRMGYGPNQLEEARNVADFVERERASDRFLVLGDFNSLPGSPVHRYLTRECGYSDAFAKLHHMTNDELAHWPTAGFMRMRMHLDHVFAGAGVRFVDFDESHPFGDRTTTFHGLSDHMPLIGRCRVCRTRGSRPSFH